MMKPFKTTATSVPGVVFSRTSRKNRAGFWGSKGQWHWPVVILMTIASAFFFSMVLGGCEFPGAAPRASRTTETLLPVSPEEDALIRMRLAMVVNKVKQQEYPELFDAWMKNPKASPEAVAQQRRYFLHTHYCAERFLGKLKGYDQSSVRILKEGVPVSSGMNGKETTSPDHHVVHVRLVTSRDQSPEVEELYTLLQEGLTYKFTGYFIKSRRVGFHDCMARIAFPKAVAYKKQTP
jgi:hypothetical protein